MTAARLGHDIHGPDSAPALVLGSSLGTTREIWDPYLPWLTPHFRVIRYDHLGHGDSDAPPGPYTIEQLGDTLLALLDDLGVGRAHIAGLSLGGMVALHMAAAHPDRVDRLVVICSSAYLPPAQTWRERAASVRAGGTAAIADAVVARWFTPAFAESPTAKACRASLLAVPATGYAACCEAIAAMDLRPALGSVTAPTVVVAGADDPAIPQEHAEIIAAGVRVTGAPARVAIVPGAHLASVEQPVRVRQVLLEHLGAGAPARYAVTRPTTAVTTNDAEETS